MLNKFNKYNLHVSVDFSQLITNLGHQFPNSGNVRQVRELIFKTYNSRHHTSWLALTPGWPFMN